jgi:hypothetical protein
MNRGDLTTEAQRHREEEKRRRGEEKGRQGDNPLLSLPSFSSLLLLFSVSQCLCG